MLPVICLSVCIFSCIWQDCNQKPSMQQSRCKSQVKKDIKNFLEIFSEWRIKILVVLLEPTFWKNKIEIMKILSPKFTWLESYSSSDAGWKVLFLHLSSRLLLPPSVTSTASTSTIFTSKARLSSTFAFLPSLSGSKMPLRERQKTKLGYIYGALVQGVSRPKEWTFFPFEIYRSMVGQNWVKKNFFFRS